MSLMLNCYAYYYFFASLFFLVLFYRENEKKKKKNSYLVGEENLGFPFICFFVCYNSCVIRLCVD